MQPESPNAPTSPKNPIVPTSLKPNSSSFGQPCDLSCPYLLWDKNRFVAEDLDIHRKNPQVQLFDSVTLGTQGHRQECLCHKMQDRAVW